MAHPQNAQQLESDYERGVEHVTEQEYCGPQEHLGVLPSVCAVRYQHYIRAVENPRTAQRYLYDYQHG